MIKNLNHIIFLLCIIGLSTHYVYSNEHPGVCIRFNGLRDGDTFNRYPINFIDTVSKGAFRIWDLSEAPVGKPYKTAIKSLNDSLGIYRITRKNNALYYHQDSTSTTNTGFENNLWGVKFEKEEPYITSNMIFGFTTLSEFKSTGVYCDKLNYAMRGNTHTTVDASGTLIMPEGDTITNILRVRNIRQFHLQYYSRDSLIIEINDDEYQNAIDRQQILILDQRRWYAMGYRYPILESQTLIRQIDNEIIHQESDYTPTEEMATLESDYENQDIRKQITENKITIAESDSISYGTKSDGLIDYSFTQNRTGHNVSIEFSSIQPIDITFLLADAMGIVYNSYSRHCNPGEVESITISYENVPGNGPYIIYICANSIRLSEKFYR